MASASSYTTQQDISSLREAALLTLKSRIKPRRPARHASLEKPDDTSSIASTRRAAPSPELDYGSDDTPANDTTVQADEEKEGGEKEEGEISDDETQQVAKSSFSMMDIDKEPLPGLNFMDNGTSASPLTDSGGAGLSNPFLSRPSASMLSSSKRSPVSDFRSLSIQRSANIDAKHARPSLEMTVHELAEAKEIILDLLGWNVPPEYLINCGLTKEAIYYVFTELNLRLPSNLDISSISSYGPPGESPKIIPQSTVPQSEHYKPASPTSSQPITVSPGRSSPSLSPTTAQLYALPPTQQPLNTVQTNSVDMYADSIPGFESQDALSPNASEAVSSATIADGTSAAQSITEVPKHGYSGNLDEIETLRRQELLARKAALASRRKLEAKKQKLSTFALNAKPAAPSETPTVPIEAVDDFLNSIVSTTTTISESKEGTVDIVMNDGISETLASPVEFPGTSERSTLPKRPTTKRAVAADWIDYEPSPRNNSHLALNGNGRPMNLQRSSSTSTPSFASLLPNRKVIIDFSDSEDDLPESSSKSTRTLAITDINTVQTSTSSETGSATTVSQQTKSIRISNPDALLLKEKEQEIKRMKELIAERERNRQKSLSKPPQSATPPPALSPPAAPSIVKLSPLAPPFNPSGNVLNPLEEMYNLSLKQELNRTPPSPLNGVDELSTPNDSQQEDSDMKDDFSTGQTGAQTSVPTDVLSSDPTVAKATNTPVPVTVEHEQVVPDLSSHPPYFSAHTSGNNAASSSKTYYYTDYISPFSIFPVNQASFTTDSNSKKPVPSLSSATFLPTSVDRPLSEQISQLLQPLRREVVSRVDPMQLLCTFEIPGGGKCQDSTCSYVHIRDFEPTDDEIAQHLSQILSTPQLSFQMIRTALSRVRASKQEMSLNSRVLQALDHLGVR